jgi:hypothetical protein
MAVGPLALLLGDKVQDGRGLRERRETGEKFFYFESGITL